MHAVTKAGGPEDNEADSARDYVARPVCVIADNPDTPSRGWDDALDEDESSYEAEEALASLMASIAYEPAAPGVDTKPVDIDSVTAWFLKVVVWLFVSIEAN